MKGESRNQRRSRRRRETKDERQQIRLERLPILVFCNWAASPLGIHGFIYNHSRFSNGQRVTTSCILYQAKTSVALYVKTLHTTYNVKLMSDNWIQVGAGHQLNRLKYKLWPKLVFISLFLRTRTHRTYSPGGIGYVECMERFKYLSTQCT